MTNIFYYPKVFSRYFPIDFLWLRVGEVYVIHLAENGRYDRAVRCQNTKVVMLTAIMWV